MSVFLGSSGRSDREERRWSAVCRDRVRERFRLGCARVYICLSRLGLPADVAGELVRNWMRTDCPIMPECVHLTERAQ